LKILKILKKFEKIYRVQSRSIDAGKRQKTATKRTNVAKGVAKGKNRDIHKNTIHKHIVSPVNSLLSPNIRYVKP
jgi:hypothetical protein